MAVVPDTLALTLNEFQPLIHAGGSLTFEPMVTNLTLTGYSPILYVFTATIASERVYVVAASSRTTVVEDERITIVENLGRISDA